MRNLIIYLFLILQNISNLVYADEVRDFQIEGISIGDSLLTHLSKNEIVNEIEINKNAYRKYSDEFGEVYIFNKFETYDRLSFLVKPHDNQYIIYFIKGSISFDEKLDQCFEKKKEIKNEFSKIFRNAKQQTKSLKYSFDPTGKSVTYNDYFYLVSGDYARVGCSKYRKDLKIQNNWADSLQVVIGTEEVLNWFDNPIN